MAICRICGKRFVVNSNTADNICTNENCWKKAWNNAVKPLRALKKVSRHRTTNEEKELIIKLHRMGEKRRKITDNYGLEMSYQTVCKIVKEYEKTEAEGENGKEKV